MAQSSHWLAQPAEAKAALKTRALFFTSSSTPLAARLTSNVPSSELHIDDSGRWRTLQAVWRPGLAPAKEQPHVRLRTDGRVSVAYLQLCLAPHVHLSDVCAGAHTRRLL